MVYFSREKVNSLTMTDMIRLAAGVSQQTFQHGSRSLAALRSAGLGRTFRRGSDGFGPCVLESPIAKIVRILLLWPLLFASLLPATELEVVVAPRTTVVEHEGITGGGYPVFVGERSFVIYPNHPDDFGGSAGTGSAQSEDGGQTWTRGTDGWPIPEMIDLWIDQLENGDLLAMGIRWVPDPQKRRDVTAQVAPADAWKIAISKDRGRNWTIENAAIDCPPELGVIVRPVPHIFDDGSGVLLMPAYAWSRLGNSAVLLQSEDRGRHWSVRSIVTTAVAMIEAGAVVSTPWLETTVSPTKDGALLAIVRTGSNAGSSLVSVRSTDSGKTWGAPEKLSFAGKLPTLQLLPNGVLTLVTALSRNHCRLYLSADGTGLVWSDAHIITSLSGGNVGAAMTGADSLIITTPSLRRINAWSMRVGPRSEVVSDITAPTNIMFSKGTLTWTASSGAVAYRVTPVLIKLGPDYTETDILPYATIQTPEATPRLELGRQLLPSSTYVFEISAVDHDGQVSPVVRSQTF